MNHETTVDKRYNTHEAKEEAKESHSFSAGTEKASEKYTVREANDGQLFSTGKGFRFCILDPQGVIVAQTDSRAHAEMFEKALEQDSKEDKKIHRAA